MSGELIGVLACLTVVGSLNIAILVFVFKLSRELGSMGVRVDHLEKGVTDALGARLDQFEEKVIERVAHFEQRMTKRVDHLEQRMTKRSDEIQVLVMETRTLKELVAKAMDLPPETIA